MPAGIVSEFMEDPLEKQATRTDASQTGTVNAEPAAQSKVAAREAVQSRMAHRFSQVVAVLMRDPKLKKIKLEDLEWLVIPAVLSGQFRLGYAARSTGELAKGPGGLAHPVAVALWASVSDELDKKMADNPDKQLRLGPVDWTSGKNLWLIATAGEPRAIMAFMKQLHENDFKGKTVKMRVKEKSGQAVIKHLGDRLDE